MTLQTCLATCAGKYTVGGMTYALCSAKCYADNQDDFISVDSSKITFFTEDIWQKVSHDLLKYLMECGDCTANCARAAERAFLSTGWERYAKVSDVADTVYNIVEAKLTCGKGAANLGKDWVNSNLNERLRFYRIDGVEPEPVVPPWVILVDKGGNCDGIRYQCKPGLSCYKGICIKTEDVTPLPFPKCREEGESCDITHWCCPGLSCKQGVCYVPEEEPITDSPTLIAPGFALIEHEIEVSGLTPAKNQRVHIEIEKLGLDKAIGSTISDESRKFSLKVKLNKIGTNLIHSEIETIGWNKTSDTATIVTINYAVLALIMVMIVVLIWRLKKK